MFPEDKSFGVENYFSPGTLKRWANEARNCNLRHDFGGELRKITLNDEFLRIGRELPYQFMSDTSWDSTENFQDIPRGFVQDIGEIALVMFCSRIIRHGIPEIKLTEIMKHHCIEFVLKEASIWGITEGEGIGILFDKLRQIDDAYKSPSS